MQGFERMDGQLLDAAVGHLVPAGSMFAFLAAHRAEVFPDADYADLFAPPGVGRPSLPATRMAAVLTLQVLHDYSDREAAEAVRFDVRWKVAIGAPLDDPGFDPSSLVYWRNRIARSARPHRINDAVRKVVRGDRGAEGPAPPGGGLHDPGRRGGHPGHRDPAGLRDPPGGPGGARRGGADRGGVHRPRLQQAGQAGDRLGRPGREGRAGVGAGQRRERAGGGVGRRDLDERAASALALLALVAGQDVEPAEGSDGRDGRWRIARKVAGDRVISTVDPDARHTRKSPEARRDGYRAHLAADPETGIITDEKLTRAAGQENSDPAVAEEFLAGRGSARLDRPRPADRPGQGGGAGCWPGTAIPPTAPVTCAARSRRPGTRR